MRRAAILSAELEAISTRGAQRRAAFDPAPPALIQGNREVLIWLIQERVVEWRIGEHPNALAVG